MSFEILDSVPIPHRTERKSYPFLDLEVDQCFMVKCSNRKEEQSVRSSATHYNNIHPDRRYIVRRMPNSEGTNSEFTVGVWRIS